MMTDNTVREIPKTLGAALYYCAARLESSGVFFGHGTDNAWDEAVQLVLGVLGLPVDCDDTVLPQPLDEAAFFTLQGMLERRIEGRVPLPYLLRRAWFAGLEFHCDERAIIPRSPIAELIAQEFRPWYQGPPPRRVLDLCCGGGCIGLAVAHYYPQVEVDLVDLDEQALALAAENISSLGLGRRASIVHSDLFSGLKSRGYDLILSNPPYVNQADLSSMPDEYFHEPELALGSGPDGLTLTRIILAQAAGFLNDDGLLFVELGNSWVDLEVLYPTIPFTWVEFENGGHGVLAISKKELQEYSTSFTG